MKLEITVHTMGTPIKVSWSVFRSWTGERFVNGTRFYGRRFVYLTTERYHGPSADDKAALPNYSE